MIPLFCDDILAETKVDEGVHYPLHITMWNV